VYKSDIQLRRQLPYAGHGSDPARAGEAGLDREPMAHRQHGHRVATAPRALALRKRGYDGGALHDAHVGEALCVPWRLPESGREQG